MSKYIKIETQANIENLAPISEAVSNALDHAYEDGSGKVEVTGEIIDNIVKITVKDFGSGIEDISLAMTPAYTTKAEEEHAGMGFTIMETFMDEVIVDSKVDEGTTVILTRKIRERISNV